MTTNQKNINLAQNFEFKSRNKIGFFENKFSYLGKLAILLTTMLYMPSAYAADLSRKDKTENDKIDYSKNNERKYSYKLTIDKNMSSKASSDWAMSGLELYRKFDDSVYDKDSDSILFRITSYVTRYIASSTIMVANHEIGGHGARLREMGISARYGIGLSSGWTAYRLTRPYPIDQLTNIDTAGIQASHLYAENIKMRAIEDGKINPTYGIGYYMSQYDQPGYIFSTKALNSSGHDIANYIKDVNAVYGKNYLTPNKVKSYAYLDLVDPFLFYSAYSYLANSDVGIPMMQFGDVGYIPATRAVLAPYGLERRLVNHFKVDDKYVRLSLSHGKNKQFTSYSISALTNQVIKFDHVSFGGEFAFWSQPKLTSIKPLRGKSKPGCYVSINTEYAITDSTKATLAAGYKTPGFVEGAPQKASPILRIGMKLDL